jgi:hypothetical protein
MVPPVADAVGLSTSVVPRFTVVRSMISGSSNWLVKIA